MQTFFKTAPELELGVTCPGIGVRVCEAGRGDVEGTVSIFAAADWQEEVPAVLESCWWGGGILPFGTLTTWDGAGSLLAGPVVGIGVLSTRRGQALLVPGDIPKVGEILHCKSCKMLLLSQ